MKNKISLDWSEDAKEELYAIYDYYEFINLLYGLRCVEEIERQLENVKDHPLLGVESLKRKGVRKLIIADTPYIVTYKLLPNQETPEVANILSVMSGKNFEKTKHY